MIQAAMPFCRWAFSAALLLALPGVAQEPTFSAGVSLVHVDVQVINGQGNVLAGLRQKDFRVFEDAREQHILTFTAEEQPLDLVLLEDVSHSMARAVEDFAAAGQMALDQLHAGDRVAVMTFDTRTKIAASFTDNLTEVKATLRRIGKAGRGRTHAIDAAYDAAALLRRSGTAEEKMQRRRAVLIFTDNATWGDKHAVESVAEALDEADATLCGLITRSRPLRSIVRRPYVEPEYRMTGGIWPLADATGGELLRARDIDTELPEMLRRIRSRYGLYYKAREGEADTKAERMRNIAVELGEETRRRFPGARVVYAVRHGIRLGQ